MLTGAWKSINELEECLTLDELLAIIGAGREKEERLYRMMVVVAGGEWDSSDEENDIADDIRNGGVLDEKGLDLDLGIGYEIHE
jgi:hypothetical protein